MAVADRRNRGAILGLTGPAYLWLTATIFLPLSAMLYCSFLAKSPLVPAPASFTLKHYAAFIDRPVYQQLMLWSLELGAVVTLCCLVIGYPAALALAKVIKGRWREAMFLMVVLPFWSNALVRTFSWTMVLRSDGLGGPGDPLRCAGGAEVRSALFLSGGRGRARPLLPAVHDPHLLHLAAGDRRFRDRGGAQPRRALRRPVSPVVLPDEPAGRAGWLGADLRAGGRIVHGAAHPGRASRRRPSA